MMAPPIKVLHLISACSVGGCEAQVLALLARMDRSRYEPWLAYFEEQPDAAAPIVSDFEGLGVRTVDLNGQGRIDPAATLRLLGLLRRERFELVHSHSLRAELAAAAAARLTSRRPRLIRTVHNTDDFYMRAPARWLTRLTARSLDSVVAISDAVVEHLRLYSDLPAEKITRIYYGLDGAPYAGIPPASRAGRPPTVGMIARLAPQKGHTVLLDALPRVVARVPDLRVELVGHEQTTTQAELTAYARARGVSEHVHFTGFRSDVAALLAGWDVKVLPSLWEGFGLVLIEAMAAGRPVVASRVGPVPEIVVHGETGLLVEPGQGEPLAEALIELLENPPLAARLGEQGRKRVAQAFGLERMISETEALYERLLEAPRELVASR